MTQPDYEAEVLRVWAQHPLDGAHDLGHLRRVWRVSKTLARQLGGAVDMELLEAASYLHDIINLPKDNPQRRHASALSADHAVRYIAQFGWSSERLKSLHHAIEAHSFSAQIAPRSVEAKLLQDADRMDALGAIGIARCFSVSGQLGRALFDPDDPLADARPLDDTTFALDHFEAKLFRISETMQTLPGRAMAASRVQVMRDFVTTLVAEVA